MTATATGERESPPVFLGVKETRLPASTEVERDFERLYSSLWDTAMRSWEPVIGHDAAADVFCEAAYEVWMRLAHLTLEQRSPAAFMANVNFRAIDYIRRNRRLEELTPEVEQLPDASDALEATSPHVASEALDLERLIGTVVESLTERDRQVYVLVRDHRLPYKEVAELLGMAERTVAIHMTRVNARFKRELTRAGYRISPPTAKALIPSITEERPND